MKKTYSTLEINKFFVDFLGWEINKTNEVKIPYDLYTPKTVRELETLNYDCEMDLFDIPFQTSYNFIMAVVEKIQDFDECERFEIGKDEISIEFNYGTDTHDECYFQDAYSWNVGELPKVSQISVVCLDFVVWYKDNIIEGELDNNVKNIIES